MRLSRIAHYGLGLAASSGIAFVLSGSAFAADGQVVSNTTPPASQVTTATSKQAGSSNSSASTSTNIKSSTVNITGGSASVGSVDQPSDSVIVKVSTDQGSGAATGEAASASGSLSNITPSGTGTPGKPVDTSAQAAIIVQPTAQTNPNDSAAAAAAVSNDATQPPVHKTLVLRMQPTITSSDSGFSQDLAALLPTSPAAQKLPQPAKSTGQLGQIVEQLSRLVVPQPFTPSTPAAGSATIIALIILLLTGLTSVFQFRYGLWLRRGGYATAARSDVSFSNLIFATPHQMGYVLCVRARA